MSPGDIKGRIPGLEMPFHGEDGNHCVVCLKVSLMVSAFTQPKQGLYVSKPGISDLIWCLQACVEEGIAMGGILCTSAKNDRVLMVLFVYNP